MYLLFNLKNENCARIKSNVLNYYDYFFFKYLIIDIPDIKWYPKKKINSVRCKLQGTRSPANLLCEELTNNSNLKIEYKEKYCQLIRGDESRIRYKGNEECLTPSQQVMDYSFKTVGKLLFLLPIYFCMPYTISGLFVFRMINKFHIEWNFITMGNCYSECCLQKFEINI